IEIHYFFFDLSGGRTLHFVPGGAPPERTRDAPLLLSGRKHGPVRRQYLKGGKMEGADRYTLLFLRPFRRPLPPLRSGRGTT
ncbi:MAG: hypothetical protein L3J66_07570, partial [Bacteroidales bacterium]|nr:hypothetical protein [Bacteroidales bacterium]